VRANGTDLCVVPLYQLLGMGVMFAAFDLQGEQVWVNGKLVGAASGILRASTKVVVENRWR
jgi:hypothetical protein